MLRALPHTYGHEVEDAIPLLKRALKLEPAYAAAHAHLAWCYHFRSRFGLHDDDRVAAIEHARAAIESGGDDATALGIAGFVLSMDDRDHFAALNAFEQALTLSKSNIFGLNCSALILSLMGRTEIAMERAQRALHISPFDSLNYFAYNALAILHFSAGQYEESNVAAQHSIQLNPRFSICHLFRVAALVGLRREEEAKDEARRVLALEPTFSIRRYSVTAGFEPTVFTPLSDAWRAAGLPD